MLDNCFNVYSNIIRTAERADTGKSGLKECSSRLLHLKGRLGRIQPADSEEVMHLKELEKCTLGAIHNVAYQLGDTDEPYGTESRPLSSRAIRSNANSHKSKSPSSNLSSKRIAQSSVDNPNPINETQSRSVTAVQAATAVSNLDSIADSNVRNESLYNLDDLSPEEVNSIANEINPADPKRNNPNDSSRLNLPIHDLNFGRNNRLPQYRPIDEIPENRVPFYPRNNQASETTNIRNFLMPTFNASNLLNRNRNQIREIEQEPNQVRNDTSENRVFTHERYRPKMWRLKIMSEIFTLIGYTMIEILILKKIAFT